MCNSFTHICNSLPHASSAIRLSDAINYYLLLAFSDLNCFKYYNFALPDKGATGQHDKDAFIY